MTLAAYLIQANIYLILFYSFYAALLRNETFFTLNRFYLMSSATISFLIPLMESDLIRDLFVNEKVYLAANSIHTLYITAAIEGQQQKESINWFQLIYFSGVGIFSCRFIIQLIKVLLQKNSKSSQPYSFFGKINIPDHQEGNESILRHEKVHATQLHSADVILLELLAIVSWFNPIVYFYKKAAKCIHEFIADESAAQSSGCRSDYSLLLFSNALGVSPEGLSNNFFNDSLLKRRIVMLHKSKSKRAALIKYGLSAPLFLAMIIFSSASVAKNEMIIDKITSGIKSFSVPGITTRDVAIAPADSVASPVLVGKAGIPLSSISRSASKNIIYPNIARENRIEGDVLALFRISSSGSIGDIKIAESPGYGLEEQVVMALKKIKNVNPAVAGIYAIRISFRIAGNESIAGKQNLNIPAGYTELAPVVLRSSGLKPTTETSDDKTVHDFASVKEMPEFPGGMQRLYEYVAKNYRYPPEARMKGISGRLIVSFIVEGDGALSDIKVLRDLGMGTGDEVVRMLKNSPKWKPGIQDGRPVRVQYTMPIMLNLQKDAPLKEEQGIEKATAL